MKTLTLLVLLFIGTLSHADELLIFKRLSDDIGTRQFPINHTVWHVDALTFGTAPLLAQANTIGGIEGQQALEALFNQIDPSVWIALWTMTFSAREKMAHYELQQVPSAVWLDESGNVANTWPSFTHVDQLRFDINASNNSVDNSGDSP
ncbi:MAG: hypothetical protein AAF525_15525 [Pseudomonadota bacterium]